MVEDMDLGHSQAATLLIPTLAPRKSDSTLIELGLS